MCNKISREEFDEILNSILEEMEEEFATFREYLQQQEQIHKDKRIDELFN